MNPIIWKKKHTRYTEISPKSDAGFTLVELMIVVAIIGIISAIAMPIYKNYVASARKAKAEAELLQIPILLEQYRAESMSGDLCPNGSCNGNTYTDEGIKKVTIATIDYDYLTGFFKGTNLPYTENNTQHSYTITFTSNDDADMSVTLTGNIAAVYTCHFPKGNCD